MTMIFCRACGKEIHESAPLCPHCGAPQVANNTLQRKTAPPDWTAITSLIIACFVLLAFMGIDKADTDQLIGGVMFCSGSIVLGIINLQQHRPGKTMAIVAIVLASIALLICLGSTS